MSLIIELSPESEAALVAKAQEQGVSAEVFAQRVLQREVSSDTSSRFSNTRCISEMIDEIMADTPLEERAKLPRDGASQHDHYLYGFPKREL